MKWYVWLKVVLLILSVLKELNSGTVDKTKVVTIIETALPEKYKEGLAMLTPEDRAGIADAFLVLGTLFDDSK